MLRPSWWVLFSVACLIVETNTALGAAPTNRVCKADQLELFSCVLKSKETVGICLDKSSTQMNYVSSKKRSVAALSNVQEAIIGENPHGDSIVVEAKTPDRTIQLFVDGDFYDMQSPLLLTNRDGLNRRDECKLGTFVHNPAVVNVRGRPEAVNLFGLLSSGLAAELLSPPEWPEPEATLKP